MKRNTTKNLRIGIIRGLMPRVTQAEFASSFKRLKPIFITGDASKEVNDFCKSKKFEVKNLKLNPIYKIDPISLLAGNTVHQSWVAPKKNDILDACKHLDVIESYELYHFFSGVAADVVSELKIPLVTEVWTSFLHPAYFIPPYSITTKKVIKNTSLFVARSKMAKKSLIRLGVPRKKIKVVYHGVNIRRFSPKIKKAQLKKGDGKTFLFVGEMEKSKGVGVLLKAWGEVCKDNKKDILLMVGSGSLVDIARKVKQVKVLGYVSNTKLPEIYRNSDVFVSPSIDRFFGPIKWWEEFFSYTLMEAMASGLSIISTKSGGIEEEIGIDNTFVKQNNVQSLILEMKGVKTKNQNRKRAEKKYDLHIQTAKLEDEIFELI